MGRSIFELDPQLIDVLAFRAARWLEQWERSVLGHGVPLTQDERTEAARLGVQRPERVRVHEVTAFPLPTDPVLLKLNAQLQIITHANSGLTCGYGIMLLCEPLRRDNALLHELAHVAQMERLGGILPFVRQYLRECTEFGHPGGPLESEAWSAATGDPRHFRMFHHAPPLREERILPRG